jgi:hypothetical protein
MGGFLGDLFDSVTGQQATPQRTIIPTQDLLRNGLSTAASLSPQVKALNEAYQPIQTGNQLASEKQVFGDSANQLQKGAYQSILDQLNMGEKVSPELQDLVTTNTLQQLGNSGVGTSDIGKIFGARSLLSAGLDLGKQRRAEAMGAVEALPSSTYRPQTIGIPDPMQVSGMLDQEQAAKDDYDNLKENIRRSNFSSLINTGGRILGTVAGGIFGGPMGAQMGGQIGGSVLGHTGVAGYGGSQGGGGGGGSGGGGFTSILSGLFGGGEGGFSGGAGMNYAGPNGSVLTSFKAMPVMNA